MWKPMSKRKHTSWLSLAVVVCFSVHAQAQQRFYINDSLSSEQAVEYEELPEPAKPVRNKPAPQLVPIIDIEELADPASSSAEVYPRSSLPSETNRTTSETSPSVELIKRRLEELRLKMSDAKQSEMRRVQAIDQKIARLKKLMEAKPKTSLTWKQTPPSATNTKQQSELRTPPIAVEPIAPKPTPIPTPKPIPTPTPKSPPTVESLVGEAVAITDRAVDRIALANNLFATGELSLSLKIYQSLELNELKASDQVWVQYQMAGCHRRLGNAKRAHALYRAVAASKAAPHWANRSRWWLTVMSKTARIKQRQVKAVNTLVQLKEASDELLANNE